MLTTDLKLPNRNVGTEPTATNPFGIIPTPVGHMLTADLRLQNRNVGTEPTATNPFGIISNPTHRRPARG